MNIKYGFQKIFFLLISCLLVLAANSSAQEEIREKQIKVVMRMIGHEVLTCLGDEQSRILPIEKEGQQYKIPFELDFSFDPEEVVSIILGVLKENHVAIGYLVEIEQCETREVVHSFLVRDAMNYNMIPCTGRILPKDCYSLLITLLEEEKTENEASVKPPNTQKGNPLKWAALMVPVLLFLGFIGYYKKRKKPSTPNHPAGQNHPNWISIGAFKFDQKSMTLAYENEQIALSGKEAELLALLHAHANTPVEREVILQKVWGDEGGYVGRTLDVYISKLRKKLEADGSLKIVNIRGVGYKLVLGCV